MWRAATSAGPGWLTPIQTFCWKYSVADFGRVHLSGFVAWVLWSAAHVYFLIGFRRRLIVALHWAWSYLTFQRGTRLITGLTGLRARANGTDERGSRDKLRGAA